MQTFICIAFTLFSQYAMRSVWALTKLYLSNIYESIFLFALDAIFFFFFNLVTLILSPLTIEVTRFRLAWSMLLTAIFFGVLSIIKVNELRFMALLPICFTLFAGMQALTLTLLLIYFSNWFNSLQRESKSYVFSCWIIFGNLGSIFGFSLRFFILNYEVWILICLGLNTLATLIIFINFTCSKKKKDADNLEENKEEKKEENDCSILRGSNPLLINASQVNENSYRESSDISLMTSRSTLNEKMKGFYLFYTIAKYSFVVSGLKILQFGTIFSGLFFLSNTHYKYNVNPLIFYELGQIVAAFLLSWMDSIRILTKIIFIYPISFVFGGTIFLLISFLSKDEFVILGFALAGFFLGLAYISTSFSLTYSIFNDSHINAADSKIIRTIASSIDCVNTIATPFFLWLLNFYYQDLLLTFGILCFILGFFWLVFAIELKANINEKRRFNYEGLNRMKSDSENSQFQNWKF